jgi:hypothetical protein
MPATPQERRTHKAIGAKPVVEKSRTMSLEESAGVNLSIIDEAYGAASDLYRDILRVNSNATPEQIQRAYFDRRNELFELLANMDQEDQDSITASHRFHAERKMDAVVMAMRILGDPILRIQYDDMRVERIQRDDEIGEIQTRSPKSSRRSRRHRSREKLKDYPEDENVENTAGTKNDKKKVKVKVQKSPPKQRVQEGVVQKNYMKSFEADDVDEATYASESDISEGTLTVHRQSVMQRVAKEMLGAIEDTATSFEQVINVFTLQEEDICAISSRIDKAKRSLEGAI